MRLFVLILFSLDLFAQELPVSVLHSGTINVQTSDTGVACTGGEIHDDGTFESGYGWNNNVTDARWVIKFRPPQYPWHYNKVCISLSRLNAGASSFGFRIIVYDSSGPGGIPGNLLFTSDSFSVGNIPVFPQHTWYSFENLVPPFVNSGAVYVGIRYDASPSSQAAKFVSADESTSTPQRQGYTWANAGPWTPIQNFFPNYRCLGIRAEGQSPVGISGNHHLPPSHYILEQNYPNPFNPATLIRYALPDAGKVTLAVYDLLGNEISVLVNEHRTAGFHSIEFDASRLSSGVYFYRLESGGFAFTRKMSLIK